MDCNNRYEDGYSFGGWTAYADNSSTSYDWGVPANTSNSNRDAYNWGVWPNNNNFGANSYHSSKASHDDEGMDVDDSDDFDGRKKMDESKLHDLDDTDRMPPPEAKRHKSKEQPFLRQYEEAQLGYRILSEDIEISELLKQISPIDFINAGFKFLKLQPVF